MFERYTEKARRVIFFARYEASQLGSPLIESEHLLLGIVREDKTLASRFLDATAAESIRNQIVQRVQPRAKLGLSVDLPLSRESKRILAFGAEEATLLNHRDIGTPHLLLGILRQQDSFAAQILLERGLHLTTVREEVARDLKGSPLGTGSLPVSGSGATAAQLMRLLEPRSQAGDVTFAREPRVGLHRPDFAIYAGSVDAIVPFLCISIAREEPLADLLGTLENFLTAGSAEVWLLVPEHKRAYTYTSVAGLRECKGDVLRFENPLVELPLDQVFS